MVHLEICHLFTKLLLICWPCLWFSSRLRIIAELRCGDLFHTSNIVSRWNNLTFHDLVAYTISFCCCMLCTTILSWKWSRMSTLCLWRMSVCRPRSQKGFNRIFTAKKMISYWLAQISAAKRQQTNLLELGSSTYMSLTIMSWKCLKSHMLEFSMQHWVWSGWWAVCNSWCFKTDQSIWICNGTNSPFRSWLYSVLILELFLLGYWDLRSLTWKK